MQTASAAPCRENVRTILTAHESVAPLRSSRKIAGEIASASRELLPRLRSAAVVPAIPAVGQRRPLPRRAVGREAVEDASYQRPVR